MNSVRYALHKLGRPVPAEGVLRSFIGPPLAEAFKELCGLSEEAAQTAVSYYREYFSPHGIRENRLLPGIPSMLTSLREAGCRLMLATSKPEVFAKEILARFSLDSYFYFVAGSRLDGRRVKKDEVIHYAMHACGIVSGEGCLMVGDREHDVLGATACGMDACGVLFGYGSCEELVAAGARYLADTPSAIVHLIKEGGISLE